MVFRTICYIFAAMNTLSQHIEYLLLSHNCVIVPQFGAFVALTSNAQRAENEDLFFPPRRIVRFNPDLVEDDGLLVGVVQAVHRCTLSDAKRQVQSMVLQLRSQLLADGQVDFGSIGIFTQDEDGHVDFSTCQAGVLTPLYYGLDAFTMPKLTTSQRRGKLADAHKSKTEGFNATDKSIVIRINRRSLRYVVAAAAAILICVLFSVPVSMKRESFVQEASVLTVKTQESAPSMPAVQQPKVEIQQPASVIEIPAAPATEVVTEAPAAPQYAIVLASDVSLTNAEHYVADLQQRGFKTAQIHFNGKKRRVVLTGYADETEAYNANAALHQKGQEFANSWVMKL